LEKCKSYEYNEIIGKCDGCFDFWLKKENGKCISRCPSNKAYDRIKRKKCIDIYDIMEENANQLQKFINKD